MKRLWNILTRKEKEEEKKVLHEMTKEEEEKFYESLKKQGKMIDNV